MALSSFHLNLLEAASINSAPGVMMKKDFVYNFKLLDNHGVRIWPLAALLGHCNCEISFFGKHYYASASYHWLALIACRPN